MRRDLDRYDGHYKHLVLWDEHALAIVGAYRLGEAASILQRHGMAGLYSASLFEYSPHAQEFLADGVELGRSFVQPAYWDHAAWIICGRASARTCAIGHSCVICSGRCR
ncbi:GNAT family N-acetyltransferase [Pseudolysobacter antarcticus]|uniref:GNAT family N-acetyltransferase n=1 Tax=Pseudolysobacter antarcticus TaxID=2511995 RepID=UPI0030F44F4E